MCVGLSADNDRQPERADDLAEVADAVAEAQTTRPQPGRPHLRHMGAMIAQDPPPKKPWAISISQKTETVPMNAFAR